MVGPPSDRSDQVAVFLFGGFKNTKASEIHLGSLCSR